MRLMQPLETSGAVEVMRGLVELKETLVLVLLMQLFEQKGY